MINSVFDFQLKMFEKGADETQRVIAHYDDLIFKVKTITITLWVAVIGWSITINNQTLALIGLVVIFGFWSLGATYRAIQIRYIRKSGEISNFLNNHKGIVTAFSQKNIPGGLGYKMGESEDYKTKAEYFVRGYFSPSVFVFYLFLFITNGFVWAFSY